MMNIYDVLKLLSSPNKAHVMAYFWDCSCSQESCVSDLQARLGVNQSNMSKHLARLLALGVLDYDGRENKQRYYRINADFRSKWADVVTPIVQSEANEAYKCQKCLDKPRLASA